MGEKIGMPTVGGVKSSLVDFAVGAGGGLAYRLSESFLGSGLIGGLAAAALAGSVVKGVRGTAIATMLGFQAVLGAASLPFIGGGNDQSADETNTRGVM